ncbi:hypothetical protein BH09MYX1_BH09MYX1_05940 [soil metagenome]
MRQGFTSRSRVVVLVLSVSAALAACALLPDVDGLSGGESTADASFDTTIDVGIDAPGDGVSPEAALRFCSTVDAEVCEDFEGDGALLAQWTSQADSGFQRTSDQPGDGQLSLVVEKTDDAGCSGLEIIRRFPTGTQSSARVELLVWVGAADAAAATDINGSYFSVHVLTDGGACTTYMVFNGPPKLDVLSVQRNVTNLAVTAVNQLGAQGARWRRVVVDVDFSKPVPAFSWDVDDAGYGIAKLDASACGPGRIENVTIGSHCNAQAQTFRFDDLTVRRR